MDLLLKLCPAWCGGHKSSSSHTILVSNLWGRIEWGPKTSYFSLGCIELIRKAWSIPAHSVFRTKARAGRRGAVCLQIVHTLPTTPPSSWQDSFLQNRQYHGSVNNGGATRAGSGVQGEWVQLKTPMPMQDLEFGGKREWQKYA